MTSTSIRLAMLLLVLALLPVHAQQLIWSSSENGQIWTSDLNGANARVLVDLDTATGQTGHEPRKLAYAEANQRIYWTENSLGLPGIYSAERDGSDVRTVVDIPAVFGTANYFTEGITVVGNQLFWTDTATKKIYSAGLDGAGAAVLIDGTSGTINDATGITSDGTSLFWCDSGFEGIYQAPISGGTPVRIVDVVQATGDNFFGTWDIVFSGGKLYWTGVFGPSVYSCNPDGTGVTPVIANSASIGANRPFGITEYQGTIYFGDSEQLSTAIYAVGTGGENPRLLVDGSSDDRYPLVLPPATSNPASPSITGFTYDAGTGAVQITFTGAPPSLTFQVRESATADFSAGANASVVLVAGPGSNPVAITTDASGMATGSFNLDPSKQINFLRVEQTD